MSDDQTYNRFSRALAEQIRERAKGLDAESARIVNTRPQEHILSGFLTPRVTRNPPPQDGDGDDEDLPRDSAFELRALGLEFLADSENLASVTSLPVTISLNLYVRCTPTFDEQRNLGSWRREHDGGNAGAQRIQPVVSAWRRVELSRFTREVSLPDLLRERRQRIDISDSVVVPAGALPADIYSARRAIQLTEKECETESAFIAALARTRTQPFTSFWRAFVDVRLISVPTEPRAVRLALRIVNETTEPGKAQIDFLDPNLYAVRLAVRVPKPAHLPTIFQELPASFRYDRRMPGVGIDSQVVVEDNDTSLRLTAESVPLTETPRLEARDFPDAIPSYSALGANPIPVLESLVRHMEEYDRIQWAAKIASLSGFNVELQDAQKSRLEFQREVQRFKRGVELLKNPAYSEVTQAFRLMNQAMQRANKSHTRWRLFQIAFILSLLPELAARQHPELARDDDGLVDLLWFAAGGGKTEAFMGIILWQSFFDRLRGKRFGTTAYVRFPLRLLTFQQLQRLAVALAAAELIRKENNLKGARFSVGYLVGGTVTPNAIDDELHKRFSRQGLDEKYKRIFKCPFCESQTVIRYGPELKLIEHYCDNTHCPGGKDRLPVYVTDQDIYKFLPTVIVSTVDKLALLGQNHRFSNLFGRINLICAKHGASFGKSNDLCDAAKQFSGGEHPTSCGDSPIYYPPFHDPAPSILVQDELHLLNEELGTFDAHYETGAMAVAKSLGAKPWKVIGATATIQEFEKQAWELYLRGSRQFPAHGPSADDSFYYLPSKERTGRLFLGLLGVGRKHTPAVTKALSIFYQQIQKAREILDRDPVLATSVYGVPNLTATERRDLLFLYELALTYVLTRKGSDQVAEAIESRVRRELQETSPQHGDLLIEMFNGGVDVSRMISAMDELKTMTSEGEPGTRTRGIVSTNIIGHGVDVDRFNVIVFAGFTRLVAEYIQASARVGRRFPGISIFVPTPQSERDRSIFDRFDKFHQYLDRLVDPAAVTRWPEPAMRRTVPGVLCGYIMGVASASLGRPLATVEAVHSSHGDANAAALTQDEIVKWIVAAYGCEHAPSRQKYQERLTLEAKNKFSAIVNSSAQQGSVRPLGKFLHAMNSLRDVDEPAYIRVANSDEVKALKRLIDV